MFYSSIFLHLWYMIWFVFSHLKCLFSTPIFLQNCTSLTRVGRLHTEITQNWLWSNHPTLTPFMLMDASLCFWTLFLPNNLWCLTLRSPLSRPGEMSLGPESSVKLAHLTEGSAERPCSDWHGIPWLCWLCQATAFSALFSHPRY